MGAEALVTQFNPRNVGTSPVRHTVGQNESFTCNFIELVLDLLITIGLLTSYAAFITSVVATGLLSRRNHFGTPSEYSGVRVVAAHHQTELDATDPVEYVSRKQ